MMNWKMATVFTAVLLLSAGCGNRQVSPQAQSTPQTATPAAPQSAPQTAPSPSSVQPAIAQTPSAPSGADPAVAAPTSSNEKPLQPEKNPVGDIPDTQTFVSYKSDAGAYSLKAPEGWARTVQASDVSFVDKYDGVKVTLEKTSEVPTVETVKANQVAVLLKNGRAVKIVDIKAVKLPGGDAIWVQYESNSEPNAVTNKQIRQENESYYFYKNGTLAALTLWAPLGADNVDQWKLMSESFRWN